MVCLASVEMYSSTLQSTEPEYYSFTALKPVLLKDINQRKLVVLVTRVFVPLLRHSAV